MKANKKRLYHVALVKDYHRPKHVIVQLRQSIDCLSCEAWEYLGIRETTKRELRANKAHILTWINGRFSRNFTRITID